MRPCSRRSFRRCSISMMLYDCDSSETGNLGQVIETVDTTGEVFTIVDVQDLEPEAQLRRSKKKRPDSAQFQI